MCAAQTLLPRLISHAKTVDQEEDASYQPYSFWTNHHRLHRIISHIFNGTDAMHRPKAVLDLALNAISVVLNEALIKKTSTSLHTPPQAIEDAEEAALKHSLEITRLVQTDVLPHDSWVRVVVPWAMYVALQSFQRRQKRKSLCYAMQQID